MKNSIFKLENFLKKDSNDNSLSNKYIFDYRKISKIANTNIARFFRYGKVFLTKNGMGKDVLLAQKNLDLDLDSIKNQDLFSQEIFKALVKLDLRYKYSQIVLLKKLVKKVFENNYSNFNFEKFKWVSPFFAMIHFPNDTREETSLHIDFLERLGPKGSVLIWLPLTDYNYPGVITKSIKYNFFSHLIGTRTDLKKHFISKIFSDDKDRFLRKKHKAGDFIIWNDTFRHAGISNNSKDISIALIIRFSDIYDRETWLPVDKIINSSFEPVNNNESLRYEEIVTEAKLSTQKLLCTAKDEYHSYKKDKLLKILENKNYSHNEYLQFLHIIDFGIKIFSKRLMNNPNLNWTESHNEQNHKFLGDYLENIIKLIDDLKLANL